ncbi:hypothetical protein HG537_0A06470 [Torulaspora globosa]|uniref:chitinase n=1 Tax=Torulaspora globosa TaxID=48254 RepID=A0A7H9HM41_9SACH|nr:hypothetical protein HG537_0A06470 [Torulaspora sp. CBS 2947]
MLFRPLVGNTLVVLLVLVSVIIEMGLYKKVFKRAVERQVVDHVRSQEDRNRTDSDLRVLSRDGYITGVYYSNWSPYSPRMHFPHDIDIGKVSHVYYAFFLVDGETGGVKSGDEWSDTGMDLYKGLAVKMRKLEGDESDVGVLPRGCLGEFFYLRHANVSRERDSRNFKVVMCVGGWSNRDEFPRMVRDPSRIDVFVNSCIETMFKYGFDGMELDWEFPEDDGYEPQAYLEVTRRLREKMDELEAQIFGSAKDHPKFHLSVATPAFSEKLKILPIKEMDQYVDIWNMMTYDYYGEWSEKTGYHSNLFDGSQGAQDSFERKHMYASEDNEGLNGDSAIQYMLKDVGIDSHKVCLGMAAYGRGFKHVDAKSFNGRFIDKKFRGVGGASEGEKGMWLYNQLPIKGSQEIFDPEYGSAFCYDAKHKTFVGYDNVDSVRMKAQYVKEKNLAGGFWWESCGDDHNNSSRSLLNAFTEEIRSIKKPDTLMYRQSQVLRFYIEKFGTDGYLSPFMERILQSEEPLD